ncbi:MAG: VanZ family protein [Bacteroidia bacterium]
MFFRYTKWAMLWALLILILCGIPGRDIPHISFLELLSFDKFVHAGLFFVLMSFTVKGFMMQSAFYKLRQQPQLIAFIICVSYGGLLEILQGTIFVERSADIFDFIANSFGCIMSLLLYRYSEKIILSKLIR